MPAFTGCRKLKNAPLEFASHGASLSVPPGQWRHARSLKKIVAHKEKVLI
jgi:hypothetical protein